MKTTIHIRSRTKLIAALANQLNPETRIKERAICGTIQGAGCDSEDFGPLTDWMFREFQKWKHHSGYITFPVPDPEVDLESQSFELTSAVWNLAWKNDDFYSGEYGELRLDLIKHLIKTLEAMPNET